MNIHHRPTHCRRIPERRSPIRRVRAWYSKLAGSETGAPGPVPFCRLLWLACFLLLRPSQRVLAQATPSISTHPQSQSVLVTSNVAFSVVASGQSPLIYRWHLNNVPLTNGGRFSGATNATLLNSAVLPGDAGNYFVTVTNRHGMVTSAVAVLTVLVPPAIDAPPVSQVISLNSNVTFNVVATGTAPLVYQWQKGGTNLADGGNVTGSGTASLSINAVQAGDSGNYRVVASNAYGVAISPEASLSVPPVIVTPPMDQTLLAGGAVTFSVLAAGTDPLVYRWQRNGTNLNDGGNLNGATGPFLYIANVQANDVGSYRAVISNAWGQVTSPVATLTLAYGPYGSIDPPSTKSVPLNGTVTFLVHASGTAPLQFQWQKSGAIITNNVRITGADTSALTISPVMADDWGIYDLWISSPYGSAGPYRVTLNVLMPPSIITSPQSKSVPAGTNVTLSVSAFSNTGTTLHYQWQFNETNISGATGTSLPLTNIQAARAGNYRVRVNDMYAYVTSAVAQVTVVPSAPWFNSQPQSQGAIPGQTVVFSVAARGTEPINFLWQRNGTNLPDQTASNLILPSVTALDAGEYRALATNEVGGTFTASASLVMVPLIVWGNTNSGLTKVPPTATNIVVLAASANASAELFGSGGSLAALRADGTPVIWGDANPGAPPDATNLVGLVIGGGGGQRSGFTYLALRSDGTVLPWGGLTNPPPSATNIVAIALGSSHALALRENGTVAAWGSNSSGQTNVPPGATNVIAIAAGGSHSLALRADGTVIGWGSNISGQTTALSNAVNVIAISAGGNQTMGLLTDGTVVGRVVTNPPVAAVLIGPPVGNITNKIGIAVGAYHSLALGADGAINGWGATNSGVINVPSLATNVLAIAAGVHNSLALVRDPLAPPIPPRIGRPPFGRTLMTGQEAVFNAMAVGGLPLSYQWLRAGVPVSGQTRSSLWFTNAHPSQAGDYQLVAMNEFGSATSAVATVTVSIPMPVLLLDGVDTNGFMFHFTSVAGVLYVVEHTAALSPASWIELERRFGIGGIETVIDPDVSSDGRFYRVRALFAPSPGLKPPTWNGPVLEFQFNTVPGARYVIEYKNTLDAANWTELSRHDATGSSLTISDPGPHGESRFYRIKVE